MPNFDNLEVPLSSSATPGLRGRALTGITTYQLLYESLVTDDTPTTTHRVYLAVAGGENGALVHTYNARWNGTQWVRDINTDSFKIILPNPTNPSLTISSAYAAGSASPWADGAWVDVSSAGSDSAQRGMLALVGNIPMGTAPPASTLTAKNISKAWGYLEYDGGGPAWTKHDAYNINGFGAVTGAGGYLTITFHVNMSNATYSAVAQDNTPAGGIGRRAQVSNLAAGGFRIYILDAAGAILDPAGVQGFVSVQVYAAQ